MHANMQQRSVATSITISNAKYTAISTIQSRTVFSSTIPHYDFRIASDFLLLLGQVCACLVMEVTKSARDGECTIYATSPAGATSVDGT